MPEDLPGNSYSKKSRPQEPEKGERERQKPVVTGEVSRRKKPMLKRLRETFVGGDDTKGVWEYLLLDVITPSIKDLVADAVSQGVERKLFGEVRSSSRRRSSSSPIDRIPYDRYASGSSRAPAGRETRRPRHSNDIGEIVIPTRVEAEEVLDRLFNLVEKFELATVGDFYDLVAEPTTTTDDKFGWFDLRGSNVSRASGGGYVVNLPRPEPID